ncbi:MAG: Rdx family protein [Candidatus Caldarchaeum sp.]|nr:Rdx family protein [Candidatus Caldarchaeum sp.]MCX8201656.1 Rdx family protein [Candidatus Caldarchaeum sp.]MDW8063435.1 Rdx family protein [Candidatus Caldarchaeum sp.]MDW8435518.1 Rdx family protein [Candidatus Caldarchaeum sp.]
MNVKILYCVPCGHLPQALDLAKALLARYGQSLNKNFSVTLDTTDGGIFEVHIDNQLVFSRHQQRRFPTQEEIIEIIENKLKAKQ